MFGVVTHSRLRSARFFPHMLKATREVRADLRGARGLIRAANAIGGPTEFFTLTTWIDRDAMYAFMRSGVHERVMWRWPEWLSAFWLCRLEPTTRESGTWRGAAMARFAEAGGRPHASFTAPDFASHEQRPRDLARFDLSLMTTVVVPGRPLGWPAAVAIARSLSRTAGSDGPPLLRARGVGLDGELVEVALRRGRPGGGGGDGAPIFSPDSGACAWMMEWRPVDEFGTWDGSRVRRLMAHDRVR